MLDTPKKNVKLIGKLFINLQFVLLRILVKDFFFHDRVWHTVAN